MSNRGWIDLTDEQRRAKIEKGDFNCNDLYEWVQRHVPANARVFVLQLDKWVRVGKFWVLLKNVSFGMDDVSMRVVVRKNVPFLNVLMQTLARATDYGVWNLWHQQIPGTDVWTDVFFVGDGKGYAVLAAQGKE